MVQPDGSERLPGERHRVSFAPLSDEPGVLVSDPIERHQFQLYTPEPASPTAADPGRFRFPVDAAARVTTDGFTLPTVVAAYVRDQDGTMLAEAEHFAYEELPPGRYSIELCATVKIYLRVESSVLVASDAARTRLEFGEETTVFVGARSHHESPAATVTTTDDPADLMRAVSTFGSALKTTSPERSYPTLRGHPPLLERGDELDIPPGLEPPETDVSIELPPEYRSIYVATPLAYYLGARMVPGDERRIVTESGFEHSLDTVYGFEREVERVLKQVFFLDCVTRTEGYYEVDLHEREAIEDDVDLDFADLYGRSTAERLEAYLGVPLPAVEPHLPEWRLTTHVEPTPDTIDLLSFLTNDLAIVRTPSSRQVSTSEVQSAATEKFFRDGDFARSAADAPAGVDDAAPAYVQPEPTDSLEQAWVGDGTPIGANKATAAAYHNRLSREPTDGDIDITVVCNDPEMADEREVVDGVYGSRDELPFDVTVHRRLTTDELASVLTSSTDFLHYIGHIDAEGFECADGKLDATTIEAIGVDSFLLNACQSYDQGTHLVEAGAISGIVTLTDVINSGAVRMGEMLARLLNQGFSIRSALDVARDRSVVGEQYTVVGDGGLSIAQTEGGTPNLCVVDRTDDGFDLEFRAYPTYRRGLGSLIMPLTGRDGKHYLSSGTVDTFEMSREELRRFLSLEVVPVKIDGELHWSDEIDVESL